MTIFSKLFKKKEGPAVQQTLPVAIEKIEEKKVLEFKEEVKENPVLKKHHIIAVDSRIYTSLFVFLFIFLIGISGMILLTYKGYLKADFTPGFNATVNNDYDFNPSTTNNYDFNPPVTNVYNNYSTTNKFYMNCTG